MVLNKRYQISHVMLQTMPTMRGDVISCRIAVNRRRLKLLHLLSSFDFDLFINNARKAAMRVPRPKTQRRGNGSMCVSYPVIYLERC